MSEVLSELVAAVRRVMMKSTLQTARECQFSCRIATFWSLCNRYYILRREPCELPPGSAGPLQILEILPNTLILKGNPDWRRPAYNVSPAECFGQSRATVASSARRALSLARR